MNSPQVLVLIRIDPKIYCYTNEKAPDKYFIIKGLSSHKVTRTGIEPVFQP